MTMMSMIRINTQKKSAMNMDTMPRSMKMGMMKKGTPTMAKKAMKMMARFAFQVTSRKSLISSWPKPRPLRWKNMSIFPVSSF